MNKILTDYIECVRKRLITDHVGTTDAAQVIAMETWRLVTETPSRHILRETPALREAMAMNGFMPDVPDKELRAYLRDKASA